MTEQSLDPLALVDWTIWGLRLIGTPLTFATLVGTERLKLWETGLRSFLTPRAFFAMVRRDLLAALQRVTDRIHTPFTYITYVLYTIFIAAGLLYPAVSVIRLSDPGSVFKIIGWVMFVVAAIFDLIIVALVYFWFRIALVAPDRFSDNLLLYTIGLIYFVCFLPIAVVYGMIAVTMTPYAAMDRFARITGLESVLRFTGFILLYLSLLMELPRMLAN